VRDGILLVDKDAGWTSHDVVARLRGLTGQRRIGHTGTLDPAATGLLVVCLGRATRLVEYMTAHDKRYSGEITLGLRTTTDDAEGEVVEQHAVPTIAANDLRRIETRFTGELEQVPPAFSAVKVAGKRAYAVARAGEQPALTARTVQVHSLHLESISPARLRIEVHCGPGTYIRSLARDIGAALGCGAHLSQLRRTHVGGYSVANASTLAELQKLADGGRLQAVLLQPDEGIAAMPAVLVHDGAARRLCQGLPVELAGGVADVVAARIYSASGEFVGVGGGDARGLIRCRKVLFDGSGEADSGGI
jgi:tRNA pseudouridine55 synthase